MKNLNTKQWIAVFTGLIFLGYLLFTGPVMNFLFPNFGASDIQIPQTGYVTEDMVFGTGVSAESGDTLTVHYVGTLADGRVFDSSRDRNTPFRFVLGAGEVIRGWDEGIYGMRTGGKRLLIIASDYGYGERGVGAIPPGSTLIFEIELLGVEKLESSSAQ